MSRYHVRIELREPAFELRLGGREEPFLAGYDVFADNREDAARHAVEEFRHDSLMSSVGWGRVIERVIVGEAPVPNEVWDPEKEPATVPLPRVVAAAAAEPEAAAPSASAETTGPEPEPAPPPVVAAEPPSAPLAAAESAAWSALHTIAVLAGIGLGFYLGVKAARMRDAA